MLYHLPRYIAVSSFLPSFFPVHLSLTQPAFLTVLVFVLCHKYAVESAHVFDLFSVVRYGEPLIGTFSPFIMNIASRLLPAVHRITLWVHEKERTTKCKMNSPFLTGIDAKIHWVARCRLGNYMIHDHNREHTWYLVSRKLRNPTPVSMDPRISAVTASIRFELGSTPPAPARSTPGTPSPPPAPPPSG